VRSRCDANGPDDDASIPEMCANSCIQSIITCRNDPAFADDANEINTIADTCGDLAHGGTAGDSVCSMAIIQSECDAADQQYGDGWGPTNSKFTSNAAVTCDLMGLFCQMACVYSAFLLQHPVHQGGDGLPGGPTSEPRHDRRRLHRSVFPLFFCDFQ
jgi:hypothetical protein